MEKESNYLTLNLSPGQNLKAVFQKRFLMGSKEQDRKIWKNIQKKF